MFIKEHELSAVDLQPLTDKNVMQNDKIHVHVREDKIKIITTKLYKMSKLGSYCLKRILYWFRSGLELLLACLVAEVCKPPRFF